MDRATLARVDRKLASGLGHDETYRMLRVPVSDAIWSTWRRYCEGLGIPMGRAVAERVDRAFVTNDNPRSEDPAAIAQAILDGARGAVTAAEIVVELDRARAIARAVTQADPGDVVVVAGKGHETYQIVGERVSAFDDRVELRRALAHRRQDDRRQHEEGG